MLRFQSYVTRDTFNDHWKLENLTEQFPKFLAMTSSVVMTIFFQVFFWALGFWEYISEKDRHDRLWRLWKLTQQHNMLMSAVRETILDERLHIKQQPTRPSIYMWPVRRLLKMQRAALLRGWKTHSDIFTYSKGNNTAAQKYSDIKKTYLRQWKWCHEASWDHGICLFLR